MSSLSFRKSSNARPITFPVLLKMKIYFAFPNPDKIDKLSPSLQAKDINLLKAQPSKINLRGLYRVEQPGYVNYASHLPAFIYATLKGSKTPLSREGYPILTPVDRLLPLTLPKIFASFKNQDIPRVIKDFTKVEELPAKEKTTKTFLLEYKPGLLQILGVSNYERGIFPISNTVPAEDLVDLMTIIRIFSGFFHTHKYAAFDNDEEFSYEYETQFECTKRVLGDDEYSEDISEGAKRRMIAINVGDESTWVKPERTDKATVVKLHWAKPQDLSTLAWGTTADIPITDGVVFPFEPDLCIWDKDTMCDTLGLHFIRCLGHTTDGCLSKFSDVCKSWKKSLYRTHIGDILTHMAKVILIAIPAQARVFPVFENNRYTGSYLSGAGFSLALNKELMRPVPYTSNKEDFGVFEGNDAILDKILEVFGIKDWTDKAGRPAMKAKGAYDSMRGLNRWLETRVQTVERLEKARTLAAYLSYPQEFLRINMENIQLVLSWIMGEKPIPIDAPMHSHGLAKLSQFELALSAFGPSAPSPSIPGAPKIQFSERQPDKFNKVLAFRTTSLETAISDWKEVGIAGFTYNGPDRLSARYQYVALRGEEERRLWFSSMSKYHKWCKDNSKKMDSEVVGGEAEIESGGVSLGDRSIQFEGF